MHRAIALDGTCEYSILNYENLDRLLNYSAGTGEHGVGVGKKEYLVDELGADTVELMNTIKRAVDPLNIMNPGKVLP